MVKVADEVWVGTALLHQEQPSREGFSPREIVARAAAERMTDDLRPGVLAHAQYHSVANRAPNPGRYRMLYALPTGGRRLFRPGDECHPHREGGKMIPDSRELPVEYQPLLAWYENEWCRDTSGTDRQSSTGAMADYKLARYFRAPDTRRALDSYAGAARQRHWPTQEKLELYGDAKSAADTSLPPEERRTAFGRIYDNLRSYWQVFRPADPARCWNADRIFDVLDGECRGCSRQSDLTLLNLSNRLAGQGEVLLCLDALQGIKPSSSYPWMTVSKFWHFWNPRLVPIYDGAVIWSEVLNGTFRDDYRSFCRTTGLTAGERSGRFNLNYMLFASEILAAADAEFMSTFAEWFAEQVPEPATVQLMPDLREYFATAFEFVAIGAARLESRR